MEALPKLLWQRLKKLLPSGWIPQRSLGIRFLVLRVRLASTRREADMSQDNPQVSFLIPLEREEAKEVEKIAQARGIGGSALLREWVREKILESSSGSSGTASDNDHQVPLEEKVEEGKTVADLFAGRIGLIRSGDQEKLSEGISAHLCSDTPVKSMPKDKSLERD